MMLFVADRPQAVGSFNRRIRYCQVGFFGMGRFVSVRYFCKIRLNEVSGLNFNISSCLMLYSFKFGSFRTRGVPPVYVSYSSPFEVPTQIKKVFFHRHLSKTNAV